MWLALQAWYSGLGFFSRFCSDLQASIEPVKNYFIATSKVVWYVFSTEASCIYVIELIYEFEVMLLLFNARDTERAAWQVGYNDPKRNRISRSYFVDRIQLNDGWVNAFDFSFETMK